MAMLNNQTVCIMYMSIVSVTKKMQLSEILLEYVKTKCDDLNLFVGIAIVQIYIYIHIHTYIDIYIYIHIYICHFLVKKNDPRRPRGHDRLVLWRFAGGRGQPPSSSPRPRRSRRARFAPVVSLVATGAAPLRRPGGLSERSTWTNLEKVQHLVIIFLLIGGDWNHGILWLSIFFE